MTSRATPRSRQLTFLRGSFALVAALGLGSLGACGKKDAAETGAATGAAATGASAATGAEGGAATGATGGTGAEAGTGAAETPSADNFEYRGERFADAQILRYEVPGFEALSLQQKQLAYYLYQAALSGHDIIYAQKYEHNLAVRRTLEAIWNSYQGDREAEAFKALQTYTKQVWFSNGIHHDYSGNKYVPAFTAEDFAAFVKASDAAQLPLAEGETPEALIAKLTPVIFDPKVAPKRTDRSPDIDTVKASAVDFYDGVTQKEVEKFYAAKAKTDADPKHPVSHGLNSQLAKEGGKLVERVWKVDGMYGASIEKIVFWLEKAIEVAETAEQKKALSLLVEYYRTGDLAKFDAYNIAWVSDLNSRLDVVNGFIEVYDDPIGYRGSWESVVSFKDLEATKRIAAISAQAQWFEDNSPLIEEHKKKNVVGVSAKVITVIVEGGDASPTTPIGINLPNANWIRAEHGSKSVNLGNIVHAYDMASAGNGATAEFAFSPEEVERAKKYSALAHTLHVDMHEVIGHASGQINEGVGTPKETLKNYASALEEGRADLVALYYAMDPKLVELGLMPSIDVGKAEYDAYIRSGLMTQLSRLAPGEQIEESHMRNRQMVAAWAYEKGKADKVIERVEKEGKTYFVVRDYDKLRELFGQLLREVQRIKSEGDFEAGKALIETYGVKVDPELHKEVLERYAKLDIAPYKGFIQPKLVAVENAAGEITDVKVEYPKDFAAQMLGYAKDYGFLPTYE